LFYCAWHKILEWFDRAMDWKTAIEINRDALTRIVTALVALLSAQGGATRLALPVYHLISRTLLPAESAVRRLIVIMARGLVVPVGSGRVSRPMPKGLVIVRTGTGGSFQLFDTRKHFGADDAADAQPLTNSHLGPRIRSIDDQSPREQILAQFERPAGSVSSVSSEAETAHLHRRLTIIAQALDTLPRQAKRMARWLNRRAVMESPKFTSPLRPGPPPGKRKFERDDIDIILRECHALAWQALSPNTS
jgi:hypothetical protein